MAQGQLPIMTFADIVDRHNRTEFDQDIEGALATVCDKPDYTFQPMAWAIRDTQLLREFYTKLLPMLKHMEPIGDQKAKLFSGDDGIVMWEKSLRYRHEDGRLTRVNMVAIIVRDPETGLIKGEHTYTNNALADIFRQWTPPEMQMRLEDAARASATIKG